LGKNIPGGIGKNLIPSKFPKYCKNLLNQKTTKAFHSRVCYHDISDYFWVIMPTREFLDPKTFIVFQKKIKTEK